MVIKIPSSTFYKRQAYYACCLLLFMLSQQKIVAQGYNNNWCFGVNHGLDFNTNPPTYFRDSVRGRSSAAVSDVAGNLLFYTTGPAAWDRNHHLMPNGTGLLGNNIVAGFTGGAGNQGVAIIGSPNNQNQFYIISTDVNTNPNGTDNAYYSIVDMTLNNGLGDVMPNKKNIPFASGITGGVVVNTASGACNGYWIILHKRADSAYFAYKLDVNGIATTPILSYGIGAVYSSSFNEGYMTFNNKGDRIVRLFPASVFPWKNRIETAGFDKSTGQFHNFGTIAPDIDSIAWYYAAFSADDSKLYCTANGVDLSGCFQFNMSLLPNFNAVRNSIAPIVDTNEETGGSLGLRLGPDGKIYMGWLLSNCIAVINNPNGLGPGCDFTSCPILVPNYFNGPGVITNQVVEFGSPFVMNVPADTIYNTNAIDTSFCKKDSITLSVDTGYQWQWWSSNSTSLSETFSQGGTYWVRKLKNCTLYIDTIHLSTYGDTIILQRHDTIICNNNPITLRADSTYEKVIWNTSDTASSKTFENDGIYWLYGTKNCDTYIDTFRITRTDLTLNIGIDTFICEGDNITLNAATNESSDYEWQDGSANATFNVDKAGKYYVTISQNACKVSDTVEISLLWKSLKILERDTTICQGTSIQIHATASPISKFIWSNGSTDSITTVQQQGLYIVTASNICGALKDSIIISDKVCCDQPFIPNAFSPNDDGNNDVFQIRFFCPLSNNFNLSIYNRFGERVYQSINADQYWDGSYNGRQADVGTYFFLLNYGENNTETKKTSGDLLLIR